MQNKANLNKLIAQLRIRLAKLSHTHKLMCALGCIALLCSMNVALTIGANQKSRGVTSGNASASQNADAKLALSTTTELRNYFQLTQSAMLHHHISTDVAQREQWSQTLDATFIKVDETVAALRSPEPFGSSNRQTIDALATLWGQVKTAWPTLRAAAESNDAETWGKTDNQISETFLQSQSALDQLQNNASGQLATPTSTSTNTQHLNASSRPSLFLMLAVSLLIITCTAYCFAQLRKLQKSLAQKKKIDNHRFARIRQAAERLHLTSQVILQDTASSNHKLRRFDELGHSVAAAEQERDEVVNKLSGIAQGLIEHLERTETQPTETLRHIDDAHVELRELDALRKQINSEIRTIKRSVDALKGSHQQTDLERNAVLTIRRCLNSISAKSGSLRSLIQNARDSLNIAQASSSRFGARNARLMSSTKAHAQASLDLRSTIDNNSSALNDILEHAQGAKNQSQHYAIDAAQLAELTAELRSLMGTAFTTN